jgi:hypothetical protein
MPEIDGVAKQLAAQVVHRLPSQNRTGVRARDFQRRAGKGDTDEQCGHAHQPLDRGAGLRQVEEFPHYQRTGNLYAGPGRQRRNQNGEYAAPRPACGREPGLRSEPSRCRRTIACSVTHRGAGHTRSSR